MIAPVRRRHLFPLPRVRAIPRPAPPPPPQADPRLVEVRRLQRRYFAEMDAFDRAGKRESAALSSQLLQHAIAAESALLAERPTPPVAQRAPAPARCSECAEGRTCREQGYPCRPATDDPLAAARGCLNGLAIMALLAALVVAGVALGALRGLP